MSNYVVPEWTLEDRLTKARQFAGVSQAQMAKELGLTRQAVSRFEQGFAIREAFVKVWAMFCGVDYDWLRYGTVPDVKGPDGPGRGSLSITDRPEYAVPTGMGVIVDRRKKLVDRRGYVLQAA